MNELQNYSAADLAALLKKLPPDTLNQLYKEVVDSKPKVSFTDFVCHTSPHKPDPWQIDLCTRVGEACAKGGARIMIHKPPQHGGSHLLAQRLPAWLLGIDPTHRVKICCYNIQKAEDHGQVVTNIVRDEIYRELFPDTAIPKVTPRNMWSTYQRRSLRDGQPSFHCIGLESGFTGLGVDCLPGHAVVLTDIGYLDIATIHQLKYRGNVIGFENGRVVARPITGSRKKSSNKGLVRVRTKGGKSIECTPDHKIFTFNRGYVPAGALVKGDRLAVEGGNGLHSLWEPVCNLSRRCEEGENAWVRRCLLLCGLLSQASRSKERASLHSLRRKHAEEKGGEVLPGLPTACNKEGSTKLSGVRGKVSEDQIRVLLKGMREQGAFRENGWFKEPAIQGREVLRGAVRQDEAVCAREGQGVCSLRGVGCKSEGEEHHPYSSYRRRPGKQRCEQPDCAVRIVPFEAPLHDTVELVERAREGVVEVYDIGVESCHNFFADGILVHNCLIIDDPYASYADALSDSFNRAIEMFWRGTAKPRLNEKTNVVVMYHRYTEWDFVSWLRNEADWTELRYAAICDDPTEDPIGRQKGELLSPRFTKEWYEDQEKTSPTQFAALFQGKPVPEGGGMLKPHFFNVIKPDAVPPLETFTNRHEDNHLKIKILAVDLAVSDQPGADYTVAMPVGMDTRGNLYFWEPFRERCDWPRGRSMILTTALRHSITRLIVEEVAQGKGLIANLREEAKGCVIVGAKPDTRKAVRFSEWMPLLEQGKLFLVNETPHEEPKWIQDLFLEARAAPNGKHDDILDCISLGTTALRGVYFADNEDPRTKGRSAYRFKRR